MELTMIQFGSATHIGHVRKANQDRVFAGGVYAAVADGMGGHKAGELAAQIAIDTLAQRLTKDATVGALRGAFALANERVQAQARCGSQYEGMGTTLVCAAFAPGEALVANVGDSRAYALYGGALRQVTKDHSLVRELMDNGRITPEQAEVHPLRNVITRAIGLENGNADVFEIPFAEGDALLLCSDGLTRHVEDGELRAELETAVSAQAACDQLLALALMRGGEDNVSVAIARAIAGNGGGDA